MLARVKEWMEAQLAVLPKSPLGKAVNYALDNWSQLTVYTTDCRIPIETTPSNARFVRLPSEGKTGSSPAASA